MEGEGGGKRNENWYWGNWCYRSKVRAERVDMRKARGFIPKYTSARFLYVGICRTEMIQ